MPGIIGCREIDAEFIEASFLSDFIQTLETLIIPYFHHREFQTTRECRSNFTNLSPSPREYVPDMLKNPQSSRRTPVRSVYEIRLVREANSSATRNP